MDFRIHATDEPGLLKDLTPQTWQSHLDYILGDFVFKLAARDAQGNIFASPSWNLVLAYEQAIRAQAFKLILAGERLHKALAKAREDPVVKERFFTTPLGLESMGRKRSDMPAPDTWSKRPRAEKGDNGKGAM